MPLKTIRIEGMDKLRAALGALEASKAIVPVLKAALLHLRGKISVYPQETEANKPKTTFVPKGNNSWYERGYGSKWVEKDGTIDGRQTSQTLGRSWTEAVDAAGKWASLGAKATYGPYVQDADSQTAAHKKHGWVTAQDVIDDNERDVLDMIGEYVDDILAKAG